MLITEEFLLKGASNNIGWNKKQLSIVGINWPPKKGWKKRLIGKEITEDQASAFLKARKISDDQPANLDWINKTYGVNTNNWLGKPFFTEGKNYRFVCGCCPWEDCEHTSVQHSLV